DSSPSSPPAKSSGQSLHYDGAGHLSFANDHIQSTGSPGDPLIGAEVVPPGFELVSTDPATRSGLFRPADSSGISLRLGSSTFLTAELGALRYDGASNTLLTDLFDVAIGGAAPGSPLFDPALTGGSPWLDGIAGLLDPAAPNFLPDGELHLS